MYIPRYWIREKITGPNRIGQTFTVEAWGWSDISVDDARQKAVARAQTNLSRLPIETKFRGDNYYDVHPFREPILQDVSHGNVKGLITRNTLGCEVLNTDSVAFADLDYTPPRASLGDLFDFGGKKKLAHRKTWEDQSLEKLRSWQRSNSSWSYRVYRTAGGLRVLVISKLLIAGTPESTQWLQGMDGDPLYQRLCQTQKSFRARLTPKPWRCKLKQLGVRFPANTPQQQQEMEAWIQRYRKACEGFATCQFVETMGSPLPSAELKSTVDLHDLRTQAASGLPLA